MKTIGIFSRGMISSLAALAFQLGLNCANAAPQSFLITLYNPKAGETFTAPANVFFDTEIIDSNAPIETVAYYYGNAFIGAVSNVSSPYTLAWRNVQPGTYALTAVGTDAEGTMATSPPVNITVNGSIIVTNPPPPEFAVSIVDPAQGEVFIGPTNLTLQSDVVDSNGFDETVEYFYGNRNMGFPTNNVLIGTATGEGPGYYYLTWTNPQPGDYVLTAIASDNGGNMATSSPVDIIVTNITTVTNPPPPPPAFAVTIVDPAQGEVFIVPTNLTLQSDVVDSNGFDETVEYFYGNRNMGFPTNNVLIGTATGEGPGYYYLTWTNSQPGDYVLTAIASDSGGNMATSPPVDIIVTNITTITNPPPPEFAVTIVNPTSGETFSAPTNITLESDVVDSNGAIERVEYYYGNTYIGVPTNNVLIGVVTNDGSPNIFIWRNVQPGNYALTAVGAGAEGTMATSPPVNITVSGSATNQPPPPPPPGPFTVEYYYPTNGQTFAGPATIPLVVAVSDTNPVETINYYYGNTYMGVPTNNVLIGVVTNDGQGNPYTLNWPDVQAGDYLLTAIATDSEGNMATSPPVNITVSSPIAVTNPPPIVSIYAPEPVAIAGTNNGNLEYPAPAAMAQYITGTNTATFLVHRNGETNDAVTVYYSIGGTASNGVDYAAIPGYVTVPAGETYALIPILPLNNPYNNCAVKTVILKLTASTSVPPEYIVGIPASAGVVITDGKILPNGRPGIWNIPGGSVYLSLPAMNGSVFCLETSTNMVNWLPICTNTVLNGSAQFVDPNGAAQPMLFYRIVPVSPPATY